MSYLSLPVRSVALPKTCRDAAAEIKRGGGFREV
jgi:hypothetical protein